MAVGTLARADRATWTGAGDSVCQTLVPRALTIVFIAPGLLVCLVGDKSIVGDSGYRPNLPICQPYPRGAGWLATARGGGGVRWVAPLPPRIQRRGAWLPRGRGVGAVHARGGDARPPRAALRKPGARRRCQMCDSPQFICGQSVRK